MRRMSANNHWGQEGANFHKQAGYMRAMISSHIDDQMSCKRSGSIYVGGRATHGALAEEAKMRGYKSRRHFVLLIPSPQPFPGGRGG